MLGPDGEKHWAIADYKKIVEPNYFVLEDAFCDENGNKNSELPSMDWKVEFHKSGTGTKVQVTITFPDEKAMQTITDMGFQEGFAAAHDNLDELLSKVKTTAV